jgi:hypothetical protein
MPQQLNLISEQVQIGGVGGGPALNRNNHISGLMKMSLWSLGFWSWRNHEQKPLGTCLYFESYRISFFPVLVLFSLCFLYVTNFGTFLGFSSWRDVCHFMTINVWKYVLDVRYMAWQEIMQLGNYWVSIFLFDMSHWVGFLLFSTLGSCLPPWYCVLGGCLKVEFKGIFKRGFKCRHRGQT